MDEFEKVMAEEWIQRAGSDANVITNNIDGKFYSHKFDGRTFVDAELRASVAVLGKAALALVLKHEWFIFEDTRAILAMCSECDASHDVPPGVHIEDVDRSGWSHAVGCAWGEIVAAVKTLREKT